MQEEKKKIVYLKLFKNDKKETDKQPDYRALVSIGGEFKDAGAGWKKTSVKGTQFLSISVDLEAVTVAYEAEHNSDGSPVPNFEPKVDEFEAF